MNEAKEGDGETMSDRFRYGSILRLIPRDMAAEMEHQYFLRGAERSYSEALRYVRLKVSEHHAVEMGEKVMAADAIRKRQLASCEGELAENLASEGLSPGIGEEDAADGLEREINAVARREVTLRPFETNFEL